MSVALDEVTSELRSRVLVGTFPPNTKLREVVVAEDLGVSRTLARLAMSTLENEGLLYREANRGSWVRRFTVEEIGDAIEVRGELEGMAVRLAAERGLDAQSKGAFEAIIARSEELLRSGVSTPEAQSEWTQLNVSFHAEIIKASQNWAIDIAVERMCRLPLVSSSAIVFDLQDPDNSLRQLTAAHSDHVEVFKAIKARQGQRAEAYMREHAYKNAMNKRANLANQKTMELARKLPGGPLISLSA